MFELFAAVASGGVLLLAPGLLLARVLSLQAELEPVERPAVWALLTLSVLAVPAAASILRPISLAAFLLAWLVPGLLLLARRAPRPGRGSRPAVTHPGEPLPRSLGIAALAAAVLLTAGAYAFTRGGSVDRWWYLAFVRTWVDVGAVFSQDPMLGTETEIARFAGNAWLSFLALWSSLTGIEPAFLYERASPVLLAPLALCAAASSTRAVLQSRRAGLAAVPLGATYWASAGLMPALSRLPEDKIFAALVLAPTLWGCVLRAIAPPQVPAAAAKKRALAGCALGAIALASVHPLVFGIALITILPSLLLARRSLALALLVLIAAASIVPFGLGARALEQVRGGESVEATHHPVARIHAARDRMAADSDVIRVSPRLAAHPLVATSVATAAILVFLDRRLRILLSLPCAAALAICYVPPLPSLVASVIGPWMLYRVLWAIPVVPLLAWLVGAAAKRFGTVLPLVAAVAISLPLIVGSVQHRAGPQRMELATPASGELPRLVAALEALPAESLLAAAPELSERIPALSGRKVLAASDRATYVFSPSPTRAVDRLRARSELLWGIWRPRSGVPVPSHLLFAPSAPAARYCGRELFRSAAYVLCEARELAPPPAQRLPLAPAPRATAESAAAHEGTTMERLRCDPRPRERPGLLIFPKPGPWSARAPGTACVIGSGAESADPNPPDRLFRPRALVLHAVSGLAEEELIVVAVGQRAGEEAWRLEATARIVGEEELRYRLPTAELDRLEVSLIPTRLAFVKLRRLRVELAEGEQPSP